MPSIAVISNLGMKELISAYSLYSIMEGSQGKNSRQRLKAETVEECCLRAALGVLVVPSLTALPIMPGTTYFRMMLPTVGRPSCIS